MSRWPSEFTQWYLMYESELRRDRVEGLMARRRAQMSRCIAEDCNDRVSFVRTTQFSGDHPFCTKHAVCEADFYRDDDSYMAWYTIEEWNEV